MITFSKDFKKRASQQPDRTAVVTRDGSSSREYSYRELQDLVARCHHWLEKELELKPGDSLVSLLPNSVEKMVLFLATIRGGYGFAPLPPEATANEIDRWRRIVNPSVFVISDEASETSTESAGTTGPAGKTRSTGPDKSAESTGTPGSEERFNEAGSYSRQEEEADWVRVRIDGRFRRLDRFDLEGPKPAGGAKLFLSTSGTTGDPKAIVIDSNRLWESSKGFARQLNLDGKPLRFWNYLPMTYMGGLHNLCLIPLSLGGSVFIDRPFSASTFLHYWKVVEQYRINALWFVPTIVHGLLKMAKRTSGEVNRKRGEEIEIAFLGTAPIRLETKQLFEETFQIPLLENYGLSETTFITTETHNTLDRRTESSKGSAFDYADIELKSTGENGVEEAKEICVKTPYLFLGYVDGNGQLDPSLDDEGFFRTGDLGEWNPHGQLVITGRIKDILKKGGYLVSLREIELLAEKHEQVAEAAACKIDHEFFGESYNLYIQPAESASSESLRDSVEQFIQQHLIKYKWPEAIYIRDQFPRTRSGKVQKHRLIEET